MKTTNAGPYIYFLADGNVVGFVSISPKTPDAERTFHISFSICAGTIKTI
jgi:hypothetical protein